MKPRNTVVLVIIAHVGLFLIWMCMGGCSQREETVEDISKKGVRLPQEFERKIYLGRDDVAVDDTIDIGTDVTDITGVEGEKKSTEYDEESEVVYIVKRGDSLTKISRKFNVPIVEIIDRNDIQNKDMIVEGRKLFIPKRDGAETEKTTVIQAVAGGETTTETVISGESDTVVEPDTALDTTVREPVENDGDIVDESKYITHTIVEGDTLWKLSTKYGVKVSVIEKINKIDDPKKLQIGQKILIPKPE